MYLHDQSDCDRSWQASKVREEARCHCLSAVSVVLAAGSVSVCHVPRRLCR